MPGSGTRTFLEPDHYEASLRQAQIDILIALGPKFKAEAVAARSGLDPDRPTRRLPCASPLF
jgi:hypothetical protein